MTVKPLSLDELVDVVYDFRRGQLHQLIELHECRGSFDIRLPDLGLPAGGAHGHRHPLLRSSLVSGLDHAVM